MISLRHIEVFHAVYQAGSISGAAQLLRVSQPSVSKVLRHAEALIGFALFRLVKGLLVPTEEAHLLFADAHEVKSRVEVLKEAIGNLNRVSDGHLRLAVLHTLGLDLIPAVVSDFSAAHPTVSFDIRTGHGPEIIDSLFDRSCDLAIGFDVPPRPRLTSVSLGSAEIVLLFHRDDWPDAPERITREMLQGKPLIRLVNVGALGTLFNTYLGAAAGAPGGIVVHTYYVAAALVRRRAGMAVIDAFTARASCHGSAALDYRPFEEGPRFDVFGLHLDDRPLSKAGGLFLRDVASAIARGA
jgi:DNA-binding transcriptional LysR family regulator